MDRGALLPEQQGRARGPVSSAELTSPNPGPSSNEVAFPDLTRPLTFHSNWLSYRRCIIPHCRVQLSSLKTTTHSTSLNPLAKSSSQAAGHDWPCRFDCLPDTRTLRGNLFTLTWESMDTLHSSIATDWMFQRYIYSHGKGGSLLALRSAWQRSGAAFS